MKLNNSQKRKDFIKVNDVTKQKKQTLRFLICSIFIIKYLAKILKTYFLPFDENSIMKKCACML